MTRDPAMNVRKSDDGFTLVEVLVSLAIFSIAVLGLNRAATAAVRSTAMLDARIHAGIVADNAAVEARLRTLREGTDRRPAEMGGQRFEAVLVTTPTDIADLFRVQIDVRRENADQILASRTAFIARPKSRDVTDSSRSEDDDE